MNLSKITTLRFWDHLSNIFSGIYFSCWPPENLFPSATKRFSCKTLTNKFVSGTPNRKILSLKTIAVSFAALALFACTSADSGDGASESGLPLYNAWEITEETPLLDVNGNLSAWGWARHPLMQFDREMIKAEDRERLKEWDYYAVIGEDYYFELTLADISWAVLIGAVLIDYANDKEYVNGFFALDSELLDLPPSPYLDSQFESNGLTASITNSGNVRTLEFNIPGSDVVGPEFIGRIVLQDDPEEENLAIALPFETLDRFFYTYKAVALPASGNLTVDGVEYSFAEGTAYGILDWGRGVWPEDFEWGWGIASGEVDGNRIGFNFGFGEENTSRTTSNDVVYNGVVHKLGPVSFEYNTDDIMQPWHFTSDDGRFDMTLEPRFDHSTQLDLGVYATDTTKVHGWLSGYVILDDGTRIDVDHLLAFAEHCLQNW